MKYCKDITAEIVQTYHKVAIYTYCLYELKLNETE